MNVRKFVEECVLEFAKIIEENRQLEDDVIQLTYLNDEYEQFIGEMGLEQDFIIARQCGYDDYDFYGHPKGYGATYCNKYYGYDRPAASSLKQLKPGEIDAQALNVGIAKILHGQK